ncbi:hypothetical protein RhiLY_08683 [Ceratobasidium sp. AG-Ba]|nr:hypothetical protein RhiLY_08683 [Ceratobasidium sp. AG-Ba]
MEGRADLVATTRRLVSSPVDLPGVCNPEGTARTPSAFSCASTCRRCRFTNPCIACLQPLATRPEVFSDVDKGKKPVVPSGSLSDGGRATPSSDADNGGGGEDDDDDDGPPPSKKVKLAVPKPSRAGKGKAKAKPEKFIHPDFPELGPRPREGTKARQKWEKKAMGRSLAKTEMEQKIKDDVRHEIATEFAKSLGDAGPMIFAQRAKAAAARAAEKQSNNPIRDCEQAKQASVDGQG